MKSDEILYEKSLPKHFDSPSGKMKIVAAILVLGALIAFLFAGCETDPESRTPTFSRYDFLFTPPTNVLDQADIISITFRYSTNFNTVQKIGLDGMVNLQGAGQVKAEGKTITQFQDELTALYQSEVKDDPITVRLVAPAAAIYVTGAVVRPGKVSMDHRMTVIDAIAEAGGADQYRAKLSKVSVLRVDGDTEKIYWINVNRIMSGADDTPFYLKPFDVVRVPTRTFNF